MAVESKPLFHPEVIRQHLRSFVLPESVTAALPKLKHWSDLINSGQADKLKETDLLPDFLTDVFCNLLGYTRPAGSPDSYTLSRETKVVVDGPLSCCHDQADVPHDEIAYWIAGFIPLVKRVRRGWSPGLPQKFRVPICCGWASNCL